MTDAETEQRYFRRLNLPGADASASHKAALARAHELRKFEIENYWKRSSYFWGFQLVSFGALAITAKDGAFHPPIVLIVSVLGALAALTGVLTARGSKFWQQNWEAHVDFLETAVEGRLHTTAIVRDDLQYSVSRVNERFIELILAGWIIAFVASAAVLVCPALLSLSPGAASAVQIGLATTALILGGWRLTHRQKSVLHDRAYRRSDFEPFDGLKQDQPTPRSAGPNALGRSSDTV